MLMKLITDILDKRYDYVIAELDSANEAVETILNGVVTSQENYSIHAVTRVQEYAKSIGADVVVRSKVVDNLLTKVKTRNHKQAAFMELLMIRRRIAVALKRAKRLGEYDEEIPFGY